MLMVLLQPAWALAASASTRPFVIEVVDDCTNRGVPLVELKTVSNRQFYTDSAGRVAVDDPVFMGQQVYFSVSSPGYEFPADGFGFRGKALAVMPGDTAVIKLKRLNIAERLYRVTGEGIYRDTIMAGKSAPIRQPLLNAKVVGQDSVQAIPYDGKLYWFWGDTNRLSYPLGHFGTSGAISLPPGQGGLDPSVGIDLEYFVDKTGFARPTCDIPGQGPKWIDGLMIAKDDSGNDRLLCRYIRVKSVDQVLEAGIVQWDDSTAMWKKVAEFDRQSPLHPYGQPIRYTDAGVEYFYFPSVRVRADYKHILDPAQYEAFTCLAEGTWFEKGSSRLDRKPDGSLNWGWKHGTGPIGAIEERDLVAAGKIRPQETRFVLHDVESKRRVVPHNGSICWNAFRQRWILIAVEIGGGKSFLGEVWYAEADSPTGPWNWARKIATHPKYSFYNPVQHPFFDQEGGRVIYFEGTYASTFSGNDNPAPMYDYNQLMYRLDLSDPRLALPSAPAVP